VRGWEERRLERSDSSIPPSNITNNLPFVASLLTAARSSPLAHRSPHPTVVIEVRTAIRDWGAEVTEMMATPEQQQQQQQMEQMKKAKGEVRLSEERSDELTTQFLAPLACLSDISVHNLRPILLFIYSKPLWSSLRSSPLAHRSLTLTPSRT